MMKVWRALFARRARDERGSEFASAILVFPVLFVLIIGCIEVGYYVQTRMRVENIARDAARSVAADGGNMNLRTNTGGPIDLAAQRFLTDDGDKCILSRCESGRYPVIDCSFVTDASGTNNQPEVLLAGDTVTCVVADYPYRGLSGALMDGAFGLGIGNILQDFTVRESARSETGKNG